MKSTRTPATGTPSAPPQPAARRFIRGRDATLRKATEWAARLSLLAWLVLAVAGHFDLVAYGWTWIPLGLWLLIGFGVNRRKPNAGTGTGPGGSAPAAVEVAAPVSGRWKALNSPADKVPSHGTPAYGQAYAIDISAEPESGARPAFGWWPIARRNDDFPAFGAPVTAVADATVVHAEDRQRDHLSRTSWPAFFYFALVEGLARSLGGARRVIGNHVILDLGDGTYALYAHIRRGSLTVRPGDRVHTGQVLGACGNSGNSTEPHVHFQLMNAADPVTADGIPFTWRGIGVPRNGERFVAAPTPSPGSVVSGAA